MSIRLNACEGIETEVRKLTFTPEELAVYAEQAEALKKHSPSYSPPASAVEIYGVSGFGIDTRVRRIR